MRRLFTLLAASAIVVGANAQEKKESNKPVFTVVKENKITSIKNQNRSGTCWDYATLGFFEAEALRATGKTFDLAEAFVANKTYMDRAIHVVRLHGDAQFEQGGSAYDPLFCLKNYGIVPETAMPAPGTPQGDSLFNFNEFFSVMGPYVNAIARNKASKITKQWRVGLQGILDAYLGKCPEQFTYQGKTYTPKSFAESLGLDFDNYENFTSYTHVPFYEGYAIEVQDNWRNPQSWNLPIEEVGKIIDNAVMNGYTVVWGGDVSEKGFTRNGVAFFTDDKAAQSLAGSDMARWLKLSPAQKASKLDSLGCRAPEVAPSQELRQERFDNWELTDDHGMLIYGIAKDQYGKEYYMVKNSWGETGAYKGIWYMTKSYILNNLMDIMVNKNAVPKDILKKLKR